MWIRSSVLLSLLALQSLAFTSPADSRFVVKSSSATLLKDSDQDTPEVLPDFSSAEEYTAYLETKAALPKGFATGTGAGKFVSVEAPALGKLPIRATVIQLTEGPTDNWAAVFTSNMVSC